MPNYSQERILGRKVAEELTPEEISTVFGGGADGADTITASSTDPDDQSFVFGIDFKDGAWVYGTDDDDYYTGPGIVQDR